MLFIFSTPVLIRHLWQLKTLVFLHWCLISSILNVNSQHKRLQRFLWCWMSLCLGFFAKCHFAECHHAECSNTECHCAECRFLCAMLSVVFLSYNADCYYAECHHVECLYTESCGATFSAPQGFTWKWEKKIFLRSFKSFFGYPWHLLGPKLLPVVSRQH